MADLEDEGVDANSAAGEKDLNGTALQRRRGWFKLKPARFAREKNRYRYTWDFYMGSVSWMSMRKRQTGG